MKPLSWRAVLALAAIPAHFTDGMAQAVMESWIAKYIRNCTTEKPHTTFIELVNKQAAQELKRESWRKQPRQRRRPQMRTAAACPRFCHRVGKHR